MLRQKRSWPESATQTDSIMLDERTTQTHHDIYDFSPTPVYHIDISPHMKRCDYDNDSVVDVLSNLSDEIILPYNHVDRDSSVEHELCSHSNGYDTPPPEQYPPTEPPYILSVNGLTPQKLPITESLPALSDNDSSKYSFRSDVGRQTKGNLESDGSVRSRQFSYRSVPARKSKQLRDDDSQRSSPVNVTESTSLPLVLTDSAMSLVREDYSFDDYLGVEANSDSGFPENSHFLE